MDYSEIKKFLTDNGYRVVWEEAYPLPKRAIAVHACLEGKGVRVGIGEPGSPDPRYDNKVAADNLKCFDKWSKCPLVLEFPNGENQSKELLEMLAHLGSKEGYDLSNSYDYLDNNPYSYKKRR